MSSVVKEGANGVFRSPDYVSVKPFSRGSKVGIFLMTAIGFLFIAVGAILPALSYFGIFSGFLSPIFSVVGLVLFVLGLVALCLVFLWCVVSIGSSFSELKDGLGESEDLLNKSFGKYKDDVSSQIKQLEGQIPEVQSLKSDIEKKFEELNEERQAFVADSSFVDSRIKVLMQPLEYKLTEYSNKDKVMRTNMDCLYRDVQRLLEKKGNK